MVRAGPGEAETFLVLDVAHADGVCGAGAAAVPADQAPVCL